MSSKPSLEAVIVPVSDANKILAPVNMVNETEMDSRTTLVAQNVIPVSYTHLTLPTKRIV